MHELTDSSTSTAAMITAIVKHMNKPSTDIKKFTGDPLEYKRLMRQFHTKIVNNTDDYDERMNYLEQFTGGEANKIVVGLSYLNSNIAYTTAMNELDERYGNPDVVAHSFVKKALSWRNIKPNDAKGLDEYAIFLVECYNAVQSIKSMKILEYSENMKQLVMKLPYYLHDRWRNLVCQVKERGETVVFQHIVDFVRREARKMNDPVYGRDVMSIDKWQEKKASKSSDGRTFMLVASTTGSTNAQDLKNSETKLPSGAHKSRTTKVSETKRSSPTYRNNPRQDAYKQPCTYCDQSHPSSTPCLVQNLVC
jgi:hypothetical protein